MSSVRFATSLFLRRTDSLLLTRVIGKRTLTKTTSFRYTVWLANKSNIFSYKPSSNFTDNSEGLPTPLLSVKCDVWSKSPHSKSIYSQENLSTRVMFTLMTMVKAKSDMEAGVNIHKHVEILRDVRVSFKTKQRYIQRLCIKAQTPTSEFMKPL